MNHIVSSFHHGCRVGALVDLGSGNGRLAAFLLEKRQWRVDRLCLVDLKRRLLEESALKCEKLQSNIASQGLPFFPNESVDCVVNHAFFWTLSQTKAATVVGEIHRILKPGGTMVNINAFHTPQSAMRLGIAEPFIWKPDDIRALFAGHDWSKCDGIAAVPGSVWHVSSGNANQICRLPGAVELFCADARSRAGFEPAA